MIDAMNELPPQAGENPKPRKVGFDTKVKAKDAAVGAIGPHARDGFEFEVFKLDGRWHWKAFDVVTKAPTKAELRASGGKRAAEADAIARAADDQARHEQRGAERAAGEGRLRPASSLVDLAQQISGGLAVTVAVEAAKPDTTPDPKTGIPAFLKRTGTEAEKAAARERVGKTVGPDRVIKNPPDAKQAKAKAKKRAAGSKTSLIGSMLLDKKGCTTAEILAQTGWPSVSVPAQAKAVGLKLRREKDGKVTRYFGAK